MNDKELFNEYLNKVGSIKDQRYFLMHDEFFQGQTSYLRMKFKGSSFFNPVWIKKIEDCLYALDQITNNPREVTTQEGSVVPVELAKKINYESVQHLASHSQYVKEIKENGDVIPVKILGLYNKEELHTYENRFIATFIRRLILFVDKRYEFIKKTVTLDEKEVMYVKNKSMVNGQEVEVETKITVKRPLEDDMTKAAREYIARIDSLKEYIGYYYNSQFMKEFKTDKDVRRPIILTNILKKNPLYHKCYETFMFIEQFDSLGVTFKVDRHYQEFSNKDRNDLSNILLSELLFLQNTEKDQPYKKTNKIYKPKMLTAIDDESFLFDDLVKGPVDYVRADEAYINYLKGLSPEYLNDHPNKGEKEYYYYEYDLKRNLNKELESLDALLARIRRKIAKFEKKVEELIAARELEEAKAFQEYLEDLKRQEQDILDRKRAEIIAAARRDAEQMPVKEQEPEPEPIPEVHLPLDDNPITEDLIQEAQERLAQQENIENIEPEISENPEISAQPEPILVEIEASPAPAPIKPYEPVLPKAEGFFEPDEMWIETPGEMPEDGLFVYAEDVVEEQPEQNNEPVNEPEPEQQPETNKQYIVKNDHGYYVSKVRMSIFKKDANIFDSESEAKEVSNLIGGKVIEL